MSKKTREMFDQIKAGNDPGIAEAARQAGSALRDIAGALWDGVKPMFDHGRAEIGAALFTGNAYVMYMKGEQKGGQEADRTNEGAEPQNDMGREL